MPRSWTNLTLQGGIEQQMQRAAPVATDGRFKSGAVFLCASWIVIVYCVKHNLYYYRIRAHPARPVPGSRNPITLALAIRHLPIRFIFAIACIAVRIGYGVASAWNFEISIMKYNVAVVWPFALGYTPSLLVLIIFNIWGFLDRNEDRELIRQRAERGRADDMDLGITKKPNWWSKARGDHHLDEMDRLQDLVAANNISSNKPGHQRNRSSRGSTSLPVEMDTLRPAPTSSSTARLTNDNDGLRTRSPSARGRILPGTVPRSGSMLAPDESRPLSDRDDSPGGVSVMTMNTTATGGTGTTLTGERQQVVRSMLDV